MAALKDLYMRHLASKEQEQGEDTDYFMETKDFLQSQVDKIMPGKQVSDKIASEFLAQQLPEQQASGLRIAGNFLGRLYPNVVSGTMKLGAELADQGALAMQRLTTPDVMAKEPIDSPVGFGYLFRKDLTAELFPDQEGRDSTVQQLPEDGVLQGIRDTANVFIKNSDKMVDVITPDWARERATSWAGSFAETLGEVIAKDAPLMAALHKPSAAVGEAVAGGLSKVSPRLFGATKSVVTTTLAPGKITSVTTSLAGQDGVRTLTQKILNGLAYDIGYGVPQSIGITMANKDVYGAITTLQTDEDPLKRQEAFETITTRVAEDQFMNLLAGMVLSPVMSAVAKGGARLMREEMPVVEVIQTLTPDGTAPIPTSERVGTLMKTLAVETDPAIRQGLIREIEFTHAIEGNDLIGNWITQTSDIVKDQFGLSRDTGTVVKSWMGQLDGKLQILNDLIEQSGHPPVEAHLDVMENLIKNHTRLMDLYETSGLKRLDDLLTGDKTQMSDIDRMTREMFDAIDKTSGDPLEANLIKEPPGIAWFRSLNLGTQLRAAQFGPSDTMGFVAAAKKELDALWRTNKGDKMELLKSIFFNPEIPFNRAKVLESLMHHAGAAGDTFFDGGQAKKVALHPEEFKNYIDNLFLTAESSPIRNDLAKWMFDDGRYLATHDSFLGKASKTDAGAGFAPNAGAFNYKGFWQFPAEVTHRSLTKAKAMVAEFFKDAPDSVAAKYAKTSIEFMEGLMSRFKVEISNAQPVVGFNPGKSHRGEIQRQIHLLSITDKSSPLTGLHELAHHLEHMLPSDVLIAMEKLFDIRKAAGVQGAYGAVWGGDIRQGFNAIDNIPSLSSDPGYYSSFVEYFARYFEHNLGVPIAQSRTNVLQLDKETMAFLRATFKELPSLAEKFYGGTEHVVLAREMMGMVIDDLDRAVLLTNREMKRISDEFAIAAGERVPSYLKNIETESAESGMKELASNLGDTNVSQLKTLLGAIDENLNITHENKTMEQLTQRFFHLAEVFKDHINRTPELRRFYESTVFTGNKKVLADLEAGFRDTAMLEKVLNATADPRALHAEYEGFKNFIMQADEILSGAYQHSPGVWINHDVSAYTSVIGETVKKVLRKIPYYRDREGLTHGISKISRVTDQAEFLIKKMPLLKPVYGAWERMLHDSQRFLNEVFEGSHKGMKLEEGDTPIATYLGLMKGDRREALVSRLLLEGNDIGNARAGLKKGAIDDLLPLDEYGRLSYDDARRMLGNIEGVDFKEIYSIYSGVRKTMKFALDDMRQLAKHKQLMSDSDLLKMTQRFGQLSAYIPQTRKGKFYLKTVRETVDDSGNIVSEPYLMFSDDLAELRAMQREEFQGAEVGLVRKGLDHGHFSTNAAAIDKIFDLVAQKQNLDDKVLAGLKQETANLLKSASFQQMTMKRKNVAGWDTSRTRESIYDYLQGYSRFRHKYDAMQESLTAMKYLTDRKYQEGWKWSQNLIHDMNSSADSYKPLEFMRSAVIFKMLGFNVSSALMQLTQNSVMALPRMVLDGIPRSGRLLLGAMNDIVRAKPLGKYEMQALREGHLTGVTFANNITALAGNVRQNTATSAFAQRTLELSMSMMRKMEELNRQSTLLASYRGIREQILKELPSGSQRDLQKIHQIALERAITIVKDSHLTYTKLNRPEAIRGGHLMQQTGRQIYLLKQFSHGYFQLLSYIMRNGRDGEKAAAKSLLALAAFGGFSALPGYEQLSSSLQNLTGKDANEHLEELLGAGGKVLGHGASAFLPGPLGPRLNPMPRDLASAVSPAGMSLVDGIGEAKKAWQNGDYVRAFWQSPFVPIAAGNIVKSMERATVGRTTKSGRAIEGTEYSTTETVSGMIGLQPHNEAFLKYNRARFKENKAREDRAELFSQIRRSAQRGTVSPELRKAFYEEQRRMLRNGQRMSYKTPLDVVRASVIENE